MTIERKLEIIKDHLNLHITNDYAQLRRTDVAIYNESTADGYDLWILTSNPDNISITDDVFYTEDCISDAFKDKIDDGDIYFYIDDDAYTEIGIDDALIELFDENIDNIDITKLTTDERKSIFKHEAI